MHNDVLPGKESAESSQSSDSYWRSDIQGLRAVAVIAVVTFHAGAVLPAGFIGVDAFFVISGYVITGVLIKQRI